MATTEHSAHPSSWEALHGNQTDVCQINFNLYRFELSSQRSGAPVVRRETP